MNYHRLLINFFLIFLPPIFFSILYERSCDWQGCFHPHGHDHRRSNTIGLRMEYAHGKINIMYMCGGSIAIYYVLYENDLFVSYQRLCLQIPSLCLCISSLFLSHPMSLSRTHKHLGTFSLTHSLCLTPSPPSHFRTV